jgi:hypothetical protein
MEKCKDYRRMNVFFNLLRKLTIICHSMPIQMKN